MKEIFSVKKFDETFKFLKKATSSGPSGLAKVHLAKMLEVPNVKEKIVSVYQKLMEDPDNYRLVPSLYKFHLCLIPKNEDDPLGPARPIAI